MGGNSLSEFGKFVGENGMKTVALKETITWHDALMDRLHRGRGDKEKTTRGRLSKESGVPESYLFRLKHKREEMRDVAGEVYRRMRLTYERICERIENAADRMDELREKIEGTGHEANEGNPQGAGGVADVAARDLAIRDGQ